jgi:hypothetical protein
LLQTCAPIEFQVGPFKVRLEALDSICVLRLEALDSICVLSPPEVLVDLTDEASQEFVGFFVFAALPVMSH